MSPTRLILVLFAAASLSSFSVRAADDGKHNMLRVNGTPVTVSRFDTALKLALSQGLEDTPALRAQLKSQLIARELLLQAASKQKLQNDPAVTDARDAAMIQRYLQRNLKPEAVTEAAVKARFDSIVATLGDDEYKVSLIAVADETKARRLLERIKSGQDSFEALARTESLLASRNAGGAMDWVSFKLPVPDKTASLPLPTPVAKQVTSLPVGALAVDSVSWEGRYYLTRLDARRPTRIPDYAAAAPALRRALESQSLERATAALMAKLITAAHIEQ